VLRCLKVRLSSAIAGSVTGNPEQSDELTTYINLPHIGLYCH